MLMIVQGYIFLEEVISSGKTYTCPEGVYLIDHKFDFYFVHAYESLMQIYASKGITIMDGEMVRHVPSNKPGSFIGYFVQLAVFLVFDLIVINGSPCGHEILSKRLEKIGNHIINPYRKAVESGAIPKYKITIKLFNVSAITLSPLLGRS
jgi:hypothetical protein